MTYWKSPVFKALQQAWYAKLADKGFEDAEEMVGADMMLKQIAAHSYRDMDELGITTKAAYYRALGEMVQVSVFQSDVDRMILTMFAEGSKIKQIIDALAGKGSRRCRKTVMVTIRRYEMIWGLRQYTPQQLNKRLPRAS